MSTATGKSLFALGAATSATSSVCDSGDQREEIDEQAVSGSAIAKAVATCHVVDVLGDPDHIDTPWSRNMGCAIVPPRHRSESDRNAHVKNKHRNDYWKA